MKSKLVYLNHYSGEKAAVYSIVKENSKKLFIEHFIEQYKKEYLEEVLNLMGRLKRIGQKGAIESYFKMDEGLHWNDLVCALYDLPDKHLRLYCIRLYEKILIVGNGGPKNVRAWQDDLKLSREVHEMMHYSKIIRTKLNNGSLALSADGYRFEGNLMLTF